MTQQAPGKNRRSGRAAGMDQHLHAEFGQQIGQILNNTNFFEAGSNRTETEKQAEFARLTGIECCKEARQWLEYLMEQRGFTYGELGRSYRYGAIGWNRDEMEPQFKTPWFEAVVWWTFVGFVSVLFVGWGFFMALHNAPLSIEKAVWFYATGFMYLGSIYLACRFVLWPRKVANRARRVWVLDNDCTGLGDEG